MRGPRIEPLTEQQSNFFYKDQIKINENLSLWWQIVYGATDSHSVIGQ